MKIIKNLSLLCLLLASTSGVQAGLLLNIKDDGAGFAEFSLSGSDLVVSGSDETNGVWLDNDLQPQLASLFNYIPAGIDHPLTSGSGSITNTQFGTESIYDVFISSAASCCDLGFRSGNGGVLKTGDTISWTGIFTTDILFNAFNVGSYVFTILEAGNGRSGATLEDGLTINVGEASVPEPGTLTLFGIGLAGLVLRNRKKTA